MYNVDTELLFPTRVIPKLYHLRGCDWDRLVSQVMDENVSLLDQVGFVFLMVRLGGCISCNTGSFRAMRGCTQCAVQTIRRFRGTDQELILQFQQSRQEIECQLTRQPINID